jgi:hypothetical protein
MNINISIKKLVLFLLVFTIDTYKAQTSNDSLQIIVGSKITSQKQIAIMENHIKEMVSVRYVSYCSNHKLFMLYADKKHYGSKLDFFNALVNYTNSTQLLLKEGEFKDIINFCEYNSVLEYDAAKKESNK